MNASEMDVIESDRNGASWTRDCLLADAAMASAADRLASHCREGVRYFSAIGKTVPLRQAKEIEIAISRGEDGLEGDSESGIAKLV